MTYVRRDHGVEEAARERRLSRNGGARAFVGVGSTVSTLQRTCVGNTRTSFTAGGCFLSLPSVAMPCQSCLRVLMLHPGLGGSHVAVMRGGRTSHARARGAGAHSGHSGGGQLGTPPELGRLRRR